MLNHEPPPNWVAERAKCNVDLVFEALAEVVRRDVGEVNKLSIKRRRGFAFRFEQSDEGQYPRLRVFRFREGEPDSDATLDVTFKKTINTIRVYQVPDRSPLVAYPRWIEKSATCRLYVDDASIKVWELSQRTLGPFFFGLEPIDSGAYSA